MELNRHILHILKFDLLFGAPCQQKRPKVNLAGIDENIRLSDLPANEKVLLLFQTRNLKVPETVMSAYTFRQILEHHFEFLA